jgi:hypothetical protein
VRLDNLEIDFELLSIEKDAGMDGNGCRESLVMLPDQSKWLLREFVDPACLEKEAVYWSWVNRFFPKFILDRRTVYRSKEAIGSIWERRPQSQKKLTALNAPFFNESEVSLLFAILYFLGQSYSKANGFFIDLVDQYRIDSFQFPENAKNIAVDDFQSIPVVFLNHADDSLSHFLKSMDSKFEDFKQNFWIALMNIAFMSNEGWDRRVIMRQTQLREKIFESDFVISLLPITYPKIRLFCRYFLEQGAAELESAIEGIAKNYQLAAMSSYYAYLSRVVPPFFRQQAIVLNKFDQTVFRAKVIENTIHHLLYQDVKCATPTSSVDHFWSCFDSVRFLFSLQDEYRYIINLIQSLI